MMRQSDGGSCAGCGIAGTITGMEAVERWRPEVERIVLEELDEITRRMAPDARLSAELAKVTVLIQDDAPEEDPELLGMYTGVPISDPEPGLTMPPMVEIFMLPLLHLCSPDSMNGVDPDPVTLREEIRVTLLHEIGHHLGFEHDRLEELGLD